MNTSNNINDMENKAIAVRTQNQIMNVRDSLQNLNQEHTNLKALAYDALPRIYTAINTRPQGFALDDNIDVASGDSSDDFQARMMNHNPERPLAQLAENAADSIAGVGGSAIGGGVGVAGGGGPTGVASTPVYKRAFTAGNGDEEDDDTFNKSLNYFMTNLGFSPPESVNKVGQGVGMMNENVFSSPTPMKKPKPEPEPETNNDKIKEILKNNKEKRQYALDRLNKQYPDAAKHTILDRKADIEKTQIYEMRREYKELGGDDKKTVRSTNYRILRNAIKELRKKKSQDS